MEDNISGLEKALNNSAGSKLESLFNLVPGFIHELYEGLNPLNWRAEKNETLPYLLGVFSSCCAGIVLFTAVGSAVTGNVPRHQNLRQEKIRAEGQRVEISDLAGYESVCRKVAKEEDVPLYIVQGILLEGLGKSGQARRDTGDYFGVCALKPVEVGYLPKKLEDEKKCLSIAVRKFKEIKEDDERYALGIYFAGESAVKKELPKDYAIGERITIIKRSKSNLQGKFFDAKMKYEKYKQSSPELAEKYRKWMVDLRNSVKKEEEDIEYWTNQQLFVYRLPEAARTAVLQTLYLKEYGNKN